jgi:hypothetical protein|tara:strand:+ start:223 stop:591 length:369 start_codon:yes stop_codon:yes gene_type:complete
MSLTQIERLILSDSIDDVDLFLSDKEADAQFVLSDFIIFKTSKLKSKYEITDDEMTLAFLQNINISNDAVKALKVSKEYMRKRANEYPSIADQLDDIYHNGIDAWKASIKLIKDANPKPAGE